MKALFHDFSLSATVAGFIATVISYAGPSVIIFQAAETAHISREVLSSWVWAISIGSAVLGIGLSLCYRVPVIIAWSAPGTTLLAPFGCHGLNLAAITAAIYTGREAHENPRKRYVAGVVGGLCYLLLGIFGATLVSLFSAFPKELIAALAGLALFATIAGALAGAMAVPSDREAALVTFLTTASGMSLFGLSAAFWGLIFGMLTHLLLSVRRPAPAAQAATAQEVAR